MKTMNRLKVVAFAAVCAMAMTSANATPLENGTGWNGTGWNGTGWNGTGWNGTGWNGTGWNGTGWNGTGWNGQAALTTSGDAHRMELSLQLIALASQSLQ